MFTEPKIDERPEQPYMGIRVQVPFKEMSETIGRTFDELSEWLVAHGVAATGAPIIRYHVIDMAANLDIEMGVPVANHVPGDDRVKPGIGERRHHLAPGIGDFRKPVQQHDERPAGPLEASFEDVHVEPVDVAHKARADAGGQNGGVERGHFLARGRAEAVPPMLHNRQGTAYRRLSPVRTVRSRAWRRVLLKRRAQSACHESRHQGYSRE